VVADFPAKLFEVSFGYALTRDPIFSPVNTFLIFPRWLRLKMMMGRLLSFQSEMAVESITFRPRLSTSM